ncbi:MULTISPECIES: helix-turn-helix domain-containing protein [unclassified Paracoccus (in: a-proteobacteria)]|uniref:winged helix-turn-helix transcriptional regulator n=1 Tax=unclassified Paracoccus (in: a-proteobacteria) TaxID=2688777 RepID=UPI001F21E72C|nr:MULTISPECIES: helix-turn-helix domain-containing protein [unclassified Paracoccus (in: a-proteobacteria)]
MAEIRKTYGEGCIAAHALDLIGDRWALLVVRELMLGPKRFGAIRAGLPGVASNILTRRLEDLERAGILRRRSLPAPASAPAYELTESGLGLRPVLRELCRWGAAMPGHDPRLPISPTALMLSMEAMIRPAGRFTAGFEMEGEAFALTADAQGLHIRRTDAAAGEMSFTGHPNDMAATIYGPVPLADVAASGQVRFTGDLSRGQGFVDLFRLRRPIPAGEDA